MQYQRHELDQPRPLLREMLDKDFESEHHRKFRANRSLREFITLREAANTRRMHANPSFPPRRVHGDYRFESSRRADGPGRGDARAPAVR